MPKKNESSEEEYAPSDGGEQQSDRDQKADRDDSGSDEGPQSPEFLSERKAKLGRKQFVESEDSDKISSDPENSDDYDPSNHQKKKNLKHADSDSDGPQFTEKVKKRAAPLKKKRPPRRRKLSKSDTEDSASTETESEADEDSSSVQTTKGATPVDRLQKQFPNIPRPDITRVYYQSSCQEHRAAEYLTNEYSPSKFPKNPQPPKAENGHPDSKRVPDPDDSDSDQESNNENLESEEDASQAQKPTQLKRKALNSSDEEWCPAAKKQKTIEKTKKVQRRRAISSTDDDRRPGPASDMSDGGLEDDYSGPEEVKRTTAAEKAILKFVNSASKAELMVLKGFQERKAEYMISSRPFSSFLDARKKIGVIKKMTSFDTVADNVDEFLKGRTLVKSLLKKCAIMGKSMSIGLNTHKGGIAMEKPSQMSDHLILKDYQKRGLHWLTKIHDHKIGGILADEMGLGKTVQTIAFFAWLDEHRPNFTKPHLVVCPSSTMENWKREFECWLPSTKIFLYHGEERRHHLKRVIKAKTNPTEAEERYKDIDVIITTYTSSNSHEIDRVGIKKLGVGYAIFDEGHMLKNMNTNRYKSLMKIGARRRVLLTGTPLQNNLLELMSLIKFLMPSLLEKSTTTLQKLFKLKNQESEFARERVLEARTILQPFVLRRVKDEVLKELPQKTIEELHVELTKEQRSFYTEIQEIVRSKLSASEKADIGLRDLRNQFVQLRKVANHPLLQRKHYSVDILRKMAKILCDKELKADGNVQYVFEDLEVLSDFQIHETCEKYTSLKKYRLKKDAILDSGKFRVLDKLLPELFENDHRVVMFSQFVIMMDIQERYFTARKIKYLRLDGSTPVEDRLDMIDTFNSDNEIQVFMISTRAGGLGINLTSADTVIIHDIDPNPYNDKQAEDRCHRVGQTKKVRVIRLIVKDTIEVRMRQLAVDKLALESKMDMNDRMVYARDDPRPSDGEDSNDLDEMSMRDILNDSLKASTTEAEAEPQDDPISSETEVNTKTEVDTKIEDETEVETKTEVTTKTGVDTKTNVKSTKPDAEEVEKEPLREVQTN